MAGQSNVQIETSSYNWKDESAGQVFPFRQFVGVSPGGVEWIAYKPENVERFVKKLRKLWIDYQGKAVIRRYKGAGFKGLKFWRVMYNGRQINRIRARSESDAIALALYSYQRLEDHRIQIERGM